MTQQNQHHLAAIWALSFREWSRYFHHLSGYIIVAGIILTQGLLFQVFGMRGESMSRDALEAFFYVSSGMVMIVSVIFSMRLFAEERQQGTAVFLDMIPVSNTVIIVGKFLGAWLTLATVCVCSLLIPAYIYWAGRVTIGHIVVGYSGLLLLGAYCISLGLIASVVAKHQMMAAALAAAALTVVLLGWKLSKKVEGVLGDVIGYMDIYDRHYRAFSQGIVALDSLVYYSTATVVFLAIAVFLYDLRRQRAVS